MHSNVQSGVYEDPDEWTDFEVVLGLERFEVMQYTGLKDVNGNEIFEGDIIRFTNGIDEVYEKVGTVVFDLEECGYKAQYTNDGVTHCIYLINPKVFADKYTEITYEIIGNIYENPELLEQTA
ncbi:hypothetical protein GAG94_03385 [Lysinibacillus sphaericus]|nr:hypothetical protein GAG94_03385 [Lysinibacillus sphaericus]